MPVAAAPVAPFTGLADQRVGFSYAVNEMRDAPDRAQALYRAC
jgi:hypothetical protein